MPRTSDSSGNKWRGKQVCQIELTGQDFRRFLTQGAIAGQCVEGLPRGAELVEVVPIKIGDEPAARLFFEHPHLEPVKGEVPPRKVLHIMNERMMVAAPR